MDKYEYKVRVEEIHNLISEGELAKAVDIADTIDWSRVKSIQTLCKISDLYKANRRYQESKEILLMAYKRYPTGRLIVYSLCELSVKLNELVQAMEYYKEFIQLAPNDTSHYVLRYRILEAYDVSLEERAALLEQYKSKDYKERWVYELAYLYHCMGLASKCVDECDDIIVTSGKGKYVIKAMELKSRHTKLSPSEQAQYDAYLRNNGYETEETEQSEPGEVKVREAISDVPSSTDQTDLQGAPTTEMPQEMDIQVKPVDVGQYNTMNLQEALAESMKALLNTDEEIEDRNREERLTPSTPELDVEDNTIFESSPLAATGYMQEPPKEDEASVEAAPEEEPAYAPDPEPAPIEDLEPEDAPTQVIPQIPHTLSEQVLIDENGPVIEPEPEPVPAPVAPVAVDPVMSGETKRIPTDAVVDYLTTQRLMQEMQVSAASMKTADAQAELIPGAVTGQIEPVGAISSAYDQMLAEEYSGQIRLALSEVEQVEKQITGQLSIEDVLADWENTKKENEKKREEEVRKRIMQHTGSLFDEFDEDTKASLIEQLEKAFTEAIIKESNGGEIDAALGKKIRKEALRAVEYMTMDGVIGPGVAEATADDMNKSSADKPASEPEEENSTGVDEPASGAETEVGSEEKTETVVGPEAEAEPETVVEPEAEAETGAEPEASAEPEAEAGEEPADEAEPEADDTEEEPTDDATSKGIPDGTDSIEVKAVREALKEDEAEAESESATSEKKVTATRVARADEDSDNDEESDGQRRLSTEETELFGHYLTRKSTGRQIAYALDNMSMAACSGNVIVTGEEGVGTIDLAKKLIKYMQSTDSNFVNRQVAKVSGKGLNDKDLPALFEKIKGGAIIIESARGMKKSTVQKLIKILDSENLGILAILEDTSEGMDKIVGTLPKLGELFNVRIDLKALDDKALVNYACEYALSQEHTIDEYALLALHTRIAEMQTSTHQVSVSEVRDLVDDAIYYADKKNPAHLFDIILHKRYDDEDMIILREKDFMHY
ncbi:MAG: hypothetical protein IJS12_04715 [Lachnospiraceae bacterium]|nr:hypothetical protein [Lachnospiraceae bacterium]